MSYVDGDIARVTCVMDIDGSSVQSVWHIMADGIDPSNDADSLDEFAARLDAAYDEMIGKFTASYDFDWIQAFNVIEDSPMGLVSWPTLVTGSDVTDDMPPAVAYNVLFPTDTARSQGRKFLGPFGTTARSAEGHPSAALITAATAFRAVIMDPWLFANGVLLFGNYRYPVDEVPGLFSRWTASKNGSYFRQNRRRYPDRGI